MTAPVGRLGRGAAIVLFAAAPFLIHHIAFGGAPAWLAGAVAGAQVAVVAILAGSYAGLPLPWRLALGGLLLIAGVGLAAAVPAHALALGVAGTCHAAAYAGLLAWFAMSLRRGREPVITSLARRLRRTMPDRVTRYTRRVTLAWCAFFAGQLGMSALLLLAAPQDVWSAFVNMLNLPLLAAMMLGEFGCRLILFRHEPRTGLVATLAGLRTLRPDGRLQAGPGAPGGRA